MYFNLSLVITSKYSHKFRVCILKYDRLTCSSKLCADYVTLFFRRNSTLVVMEAEDLNTSSP